MSSPQPFVVAISQGDLDDLRTTRLAAQHPEALIGIHLLAAGAPVLQDDAQLTAGEPAFLENCGPVGGRPRRL